MRLNGNDQPTFDLKDKPSHREIDQPARERVDSVWPD